MASEDEKGDRGPVPDSLRTAVERTLSATAETASGTAERAQELLDEVARRGQEARDEVARRGKRTRDDLSGIRFASAREVSEMNERLDRLESQLDSLQAAIQAQSKPQPES